MMCELKLIILQLLFARYHRKGRFGYAMILPGNIQIPGFHNEDTHADVTLQLLHQEMTCILYQQLYIVLSVMASKTVSQFSY